MSTFTLMLLCACVMGTSADSFATVSEAIATATRKYVDALKEHDVEGALNLYHPDGKVLANHFPTVTGKSELASAIKGWMQNLGRAVVIQEELGPQKADAEFYYELAHVIFYDNQNNIMIDKQNLIIWKHADGGYKVYIVMANDDK